mgnify:CR=1 FL=1
MELRTVEWKNDSVVMIDQTKLPNELVFVKYTDYNDVAEAIRTLVVRGAPAIGVSGAFGMALAALQSSSETIEDLLSDLTKAKKILFETRPTAVNLSWGLEKIMDVAKQGKTVSEIKDAIINKAKQVADEDIDTNKKMGTNMKHEKNYSNSGFLLEPQHNTYDIEFWGANGMCSSIYLGALKAAYLISEHLGEESSRYKILLDRGREYCEQELFNGEYFIQKTQWEGLKAGSPIDFKNNRPAYLSAEGVDLIRDEGPKYQYGDGCLSDGVIGAWLAHVCGLGEIINRDKVKSHLRAVYKYNFKDNLSGHANPQRPTYAAGSDGGLILCSWPKGGRPSLPFPYSDEVWTGIEYQVASHMIAMGLVKEGLDIVSTCRKRYIDSNRNPFDEYEAGHWYGRALASYSLLQAVSGVRYDAVDHKIYIDSLTQSDFRSFLSTKSGFGVVGIKSGKPFVEVKHGQIEIESVSFGAPPGI